MPFGQDYLPTLQLCSLPIVVAILWRVRLGGQRIPRTVLLAGAALALFGFSVGLSTRSLLQKRIVITRFSDDPIGAQSRIFREQVERRLESFSDQRVVRSPKSFETFREVRKRFGDPRGYDAIIWGKLDSFLIHFPSRADQEESRDRMDTFLGLHLVTQRPSIVLSRSFDSGTVDFVANLLGALKREGDIDVLADAHREILLRSALGVESRWRSRAHRALPAWLLANGALERAFGHDRFQMAELDCALKYYASASAMFKAIDNPELAASVYNNWGVALALRAWLSGDVAALEKAKKQFQRAISTRTMPNATGYPLRAWQSAKTNMLLINGKRESRGRQAKHSGEGKQKNDTGRKKRDRSGKF